MKFSIFLFIFVMSICANAQNNRVGQPCFQLSDSLGTAVTRSTSFQPYEPEPYWYMPAKADVGYYYANGKTCGGKQPLTKPIVIIDGFDAGDTRKFPQIYDELDYNNRSNNFVVELQAQGYDVVVVNFPNYQVGGFNSGTPTYRDGGADYIERNAEALMGVIFMLNDQLKDSNSTEQLTIVGTSMAGLISRYTLAYMEKMHALYPYNGWEHNTKLWVSFDAPHNGANIPLGAQEFLRYWGNEGSSGADESWKKKINSPAARQMLLHHRSQATGFPVTPQIHWYRNTFMANLQNNGLPGSNGYPMQLRKVAVANGSQSGATTGYAGQVNLQMTVISPQIGVVGQSRISSTGSYNTPNEVFWRNKRSSNPFDGFAFFSESWSGTAPTSSVSYDIAPGGMFDVYDVIRKQGLASNPASTGPFGVIPLISSFNMANPVHCFIPTKSALGFKGYNQDLGEALNNRSLVCTGETPFDAYYAPIGGNEAHASLNQSSVDWLKRELGITSGGANTNPAPYASPFYGVQITENQNNSNCTYSPQTYSVDMTNVVSATWTVSGNWSIVPNSAVGGSVSIVATDNGVGTLNVETTMKNVCLGKGLGSKQVQITKPADYIITIVPQTNGLICPERDILIDNNETTRRYSLVYSLPTRTGAPLSPLPVISLSSNMRLISQTATEFEVEFIRNGRISIRHLS